jgi:hypothetical protein
MTEAFPELINNKTWSSEIHISHPHRDNILLSEYLFPQIVFDTIGPFPFNLLIKIPMHQKISKFRGLKIQIKFGVTRVWSDKSKE